MVLAQSRQDPVDGVADPDRGLVVEPQGAETNPQRPTQGLRVWPDPHTASGSASWERLKSPGAGLNDPAPTN